MIITMNEKHQYLVDDILTISVTQILHRMFPTKYEGVPKSVLENAANRGNKIHEVIEKYALNPTEDRKMDMELLGINYALLARNNDIHIDSSEQSLAFIDGGNPLYAGTYDLQGSINNKPALLDIKCTAQCDKKYLAWQLTMYAMAWEQTTGEEIKQLACIWMPKNGIGQYIPIERLDSRYVLTEVTKIVQS